MLPAGAAPEPDADAEGDTAAELATEPDPLATAALDAGAEDDPAAAGLDAAAATEDDDGAAGAAEELLVLIAAVLLEPHAAIVVARATAVAAPIRRRILVFEVIAGHSFRFSGTALGFSTNAIRRFVGSELEYVVGPPRHWG